MNRNLKALAGILLASAVTAAYAQPAPAAHPSSRHHTSVERQIQQLQQQMEEQREEINALRNQLTKRNAELKQAQSSAQQSQTTAEQAQSAASRQQQQVSSDTQAVTALQSAVRQMKVQNASLQAAVKKNRANAVRKSELSPLAFQKIKLGVTVYGDFVHYTDTGYGPQFLTQMNQEAPGNAGYNAFNITRTYLNFFYTPTSSISFRVTPNINKNSDGSRYYRMKYAYLQFNHPFKGSKAFGKDVIRIGSTMDPLIDWEEGFYGYRFVNLVPWNYLSLSSTYLGAEMNGPVMHKGKEYLDYQFGVFNDTSFHHVEHSDTKSFMERLTFYPTGTRKDRTGFGVTEFNSSGYNNKTPSTKNAYVDIFALIGFYQSHNKKYEIAGEYDYGQNAFSTGNLFSGVGPSSGPVKDLSSAVLSGTTHQKGFDFFGHAALDRTGKFKLFGMFQNFQPNTDLPGTDPYDFNRTVGGISWTYNKYLTFAFDDQNLTYYHKQFGLSQAQLNSISSSLGSSYPAGMTNVVPGGTNGIFMNMQFNY